MDSKRRGFLAGSLGAAGAFGLPISVGADGRLYGPPGSVTDGSREALERRNLLRLPLARAGLPATLWDELMVSGELWARVINEPGEAARFRADPARYLLDAGIDPALLQSHHSEVQVLRAIVEPSVLDSARAGDYRAFAAAARRALDSYPSPSRLKRRLVAHLTQRREQLERHLALIAERGGLSDEPIDETEGTLADVRRLQEIVRMPLQGTGIAEVNVFIDINFSVNFNVLAIVTAVALAFVVAGIAVIGDIPAPVLAKVRTRLANLDPELMRDFHQTVEVAILVGGDNFVVAALKDLIDVEMDAFLQAIEEVGIVEIRDEHRHEALALLQRVSYQRAGLAA